MTISSLEGIFSHQKKFFILINLSPNNREKGAAPPRWGLDLDSIIHIWTKEIFLIGKKKFFWWATHYGLQKMDYMDLVQVL